MGIPILPLLQKPNELYPYIKKFSKELKEQACSLLGRKIEVHFIEEEYTTELAKIKFGNSKDIDKYSAAIILEQYINSQSGGKTGDSNA